MPFIGPGVVLLISSVILYCLQYLGALLFQFAGFITQLFLQINFSVYAGGAASLASVGWNISRDIANLGFVLFMVVIGIATIVRYKEYAAESLLKKLIAAAIIVNFSFAIAQVFVDFSHSVTTYFFTAVTGATGAGPLGITKLVDTLGGAFDPQKLLAEPAEPEPIDPADEAGPVTTFGTASLLYVASLAFTVLFTFIAAFVLLAFALMLLGRYVWLTFLIIVAPLAWLFYVFPDLHGLYKKWWSKFLEQTFFAPAVAFFLYLALYATKNMGTMLSSGGIGAIQGGFKGAFALLVTQGAQMLILVGLLVGGLLMAKNMGAYGASGAMAMGTKVAGNAKKWAGQKTVQTVSRPLRGETGRKVTAWMQKTPGFKTVGSYAANQRLAFEKKTGDAAKRTLPKDVKEQALQYGALTTSNAARVQVLENVSKERNKRNKKYTEEKRGVDAKAKEVEMARTALTDVGSSPNADLKKTRELRETLDIRMNQHKEMTGDESAFKKAGDSLKEFEKEVIDKLPKNARSALIESNYKVGETKLGGLYGYKGRIGATEERRDKVEAAIKAIVDEDTEGGGKKKEEKVDEKPKT